MIFQDISRNFDMFFTYIFLLSFYIINLQQNQKNHISGGFAYIVESSLSWTHLPERPSVPAHWLWSAEELCAHYSNFYFRPAEKRVCERCNALKIRGTCFQQMSDREKCRGSPSNSQNSRISVRLMIALRNYFFRPPQIVRSSSVEGRKIKSL